MPLQVGQRELVDIKFPYGAFVNMKVVDGFLWKILYLQELVWGVEAAEPLPAVVYLACVIAADAWHSHELCGVGTVKLYRFSRLYFLYAVGSYAVGNVYVGWARLVEYHVWLIVFAYPYVRLQLAVLLVGHAINPREVLLTPVHASRRTVLVDVSHLPRLQSEA